jgi:hypothetical protein
MSVFLRWGIFGILGVAALLYAYNASKHMAEKRAARSAPAGISASSSAEPESLPETDAPSDSIDAGPPHCEVELVVARRARAARAEGQPLDRLLRIQEIAFEEPPHRQRLETVAARWFKHEGAEFDPETLRAVVMRECINTKPPAPAP